MNNKTIITNFINGATSGHTPYRNIYGVGRGTTLSIDGDNLINYTTIIATRDGNTIKINNHKYSTTTSKIQSEIRRQAILSGFEVIEDNG